MSVRLLSFLLLLVAVYYCSQKTAPAYYKAGLEAYRQNNYAAAIENFRSSIDLDSGYKPAYFKLYESFKESKQQGQAEIYFEHLAQSHPHNSYALYFLGRAYGLNKRFAKTQQALKTAACLKPSFGDVYSMLVESARNLNNPDSVEAFLKTLLSERPQDPYPRFGLAYLEMMRIHWGRSILELDRALKIKADFPEALGLKAKILRDTGRYRQAIAVADSALQYQSINKNSNLKSGFLISKAGNDWYLGDNAAAFANLNEALRLSRKNVDIDNELKCLNILGLLFRSTNQNKKALSNFQSALRIIKTRRYENRLGVISANIGDVYLNLAQYDSSLYYYSQALKILKANGDIRNAAATLGSMAAVYSMKGDYAKAVRLGKKAITDYKKLGDKSGRGIELTNLAAVYVETANYSKALNILNQALSLIREIKEKYSEQICLGLMGTTYLKLGNYEQAGAYLKTARKIAEEIDSRSDEAIDSGNLAAVFLASGDTGMALQNLNRALTLQKQMDDRRNSAISFNNLGKLYIRMKNYSKAFTYLSQAQKIQLAINDKFDLGHTLNNLANLYFQRKQYAQAISLHNRAFMLADSLKAAETVAAAAYGLGRTYYAQGKRKTGLAYYKKAVAAVESMRGELKKNELKESFLEDKIDIYKGIIDVFYTMYQNSGNASYADSALYYAEKGKARTLFELLAGLSNEVKNKKPHPPLPRPVGAREIRYTAQTDSALILEYSLSGANDYLWAVSADSIKFYKLKHAEKLCSFVDEYLRTISTPPHSGALPLKKGEQLFKQILGPVKAQLIKYTKIIIIPDGLLHYLPFETLVSAVNSKKAHYLIETHQISYAPSASIIHLLLNRGLSGEKQKALIAFADPSFSAKAQTGAGGATKTENMIIAQRGFKLKPLPYSAQEVKNIARLFPQDKTVLFIGPQASEKNVKSAQLEQYRRIHFATHVLIDEKLPARSCIALSQPNGSNEDGFLRLNEIFALHLNADLVTLSGCQSAKGKLTRAEGVLGLTRAFFYAGARSLLVSQWQVNDFTTAHFMEIFYSRLKEGNTKTAALQKTKIEFIKGAILKNRHPYFWAPFVLIGSGD